MRFVLLAVAAATLAAVAAPRVLAIPQFQQQFLKKYIEKHEDEEYQQLVIKKAKCNVCHQGRKSRKNHNPYGEELSKLLDRKKDMKNPEKILAALAKVGKLHSDPEDKESPTYDDLIAASKLPGGDLEKVLEEPKQDGE